MLKLIAKKVAQVMIVMLLISFFSFIIIDLAPGDISSMYITEDMTEAEKAMVIGGGSVYRQMLPLCDRAIITKVHVTPESDTYFPNLDENTDWYLEEVLQSGEENGIGYEMCLYRRK